MPNEFPTSIGLIRSKGVNSVFTFLFNRNLRKSLLLTTYIASHLNVTAYILCLNSKIWFFLSSLEYNNFISMSSTTSSLYPIDGSSGGGQGWLPQV